MLILWGIRLVALLQTRLQEFNQKVHLPAINESEMYKYGENAEIYP